MINNRCLKNLYKISFLFPALKVRTPAIMLFKQQ
jgi:hypothetical protein